MRLEGTMTALVTPFDAHGKFDSLTFAALVERQIAAGIDGLVPCGTTGEAATLTAEEQSDVISTCVRAAAGRVPVIAGVGSSDTRVATELAAAAAAAGADALLLVTPPYNKPTPTGLVAHFGAVAQAGGGRPIVFYNVPGRTAYDATPAVIAQVAAAVPEVISVKEATGSMERAAQCIEQFGDRLTTLSGDDFSLLPFYALGGHGCISVLANLAPERCVALRAAAGAGDFEKARQIHYALRPLTAALFASTNPIPVKMAAAKMGLCGGGMRLPLVPLDDPSGLYSALAAGEVRLLIC